MTRTYSEAGRKLIHIGMGAFAFALRALTWKQAALCALAAVPAGFAIPREPVG